MSITKVEPCQDQRLILLAEIALKSCIELDGKEKLHHALKIHYENFIFFNIIVFFNMQE